MHKNGVHNGEKAFICNVCGKGFTQKSTLVYHKIAHDPETLEKNIKCEVCDMVFFREKLMKHHMKVHLTPSIPCDVLINGIRCQYLGKTNVYIQKHKEAVHTFKPPQYSCHLCEAAYKVPLTLKRHQQMKHGLHNADEELHCCQHCSRRFVQASLLRKHLLSHGEVVVETRPNKTRLSLGLL